jgi:hypothetical protein
MKLVTMCVVCASLALGVGLRHSLAAGDSAAESLSPPVQYEVLKRLSSKPAALPPSEHSHGMDGPLQVRLEPAAILSDGTRQGLQFELSMTDEPMRRHRLRYAIEVVDAFDVHYVGPEKSAVLQATPGWQGVLEIPPGLPDGTYYVRVTVVGVLDGKPREGESDSFAITEMQYFSVEAGEVQLLDWTRYQEHLADTGEPIASEEAP